MIRHLALIGLAGLFLAGCTSTKTPAAKGPESALAPATRPAESSTSIEPAAFNPDGMATGKALSPDAARAQAEKFASLLNPRIAQSVPLRIPPDAQPAQAGPAPAGADVKLPDVKWLDKEIDLRLGPRQDPTPPAPAPAPAAQPTKSTPTGPAPVTPAPAPDPDPLEAHIMRQAAEFPRDFASQLDRELLEMLKGRQVPQMEVVSALPRNDAELLSATLDALSNLRATTRGDANLLTIQKARPLLELADRLRASADLRIPTIALCSRVDGFGVYQPIAPDRFLAGRETPAVLYCEVENFLSRQLDSSQWETRLTQEVTVYDEQGKRVWNQKSNPVKDVCRNRRHDFFVGQRLVIPSSLNPGKYTLRVTIIDQNANRVAENTLPITVLAGR